MKKIVGCVVIILMMFVDSAVADPSSLEKKLSLSLQEAILLAVRTNPNIQISQLNYTLQKFSLHIQEWQFQPHFTLQASAERNRYGVSGSSVNTSNSMNVQPAATLLTPFGTTATLTANNTKTAYYNSGLSLQVMQPLMRGFGTAVVESALNDAKDSEIISRLNIEGTLRTIVSAVINAYLDVVMAERAMKIDQEALKRAEKAVEQTRLYIKAGHKAGNEIVTVEANVASAQAQLQNDKNNVLQTKYALLTAIGMDPNTEIEFKSLDIDALISKYQLPAVNEAKKIVLENDIQYQTDNIVLHGSTSRSLLIAKDNLRWQLNLSANAATNSGKTNNQNLNANNMLTGTNQNQSVALTLQIPIDDQVSKQAYESAKIAMQEAEINLRQEKWAKETTAINGWNQVISAKGAQGYAITAERLQEKTYTVNYQKYLHGLIDSLELQSAQLQLIQAQQTLLSARIGYLKSLVNLDLLMGNTLKTWDIKVRL
jgi:outer membrane protein TolC